jgi:hypothetical protein
MDHRRAKPSRRFEKVGRSGARSSIEVTRELLLNIATCGELPGARSDPGHPCHRVVCVQTSPDLRQVPEPWSGRLSEVRILFVVANPLLDPDERFPSADWDADALQDFFDNRFEKRSKPWTLEVSRVLLCDGSYSNAVHTWTEIRNRAGELLGREPLPGVDYAITDLVHCKSRSSVGVKEAIRFCTRRFMSRILQQAGARVLVAIGPARAVIGELLDIAPLGSTPRRVKCERYSQDCIRPGIAWWQQASQDSRCLGSWRARSGAGADVPVASASTRSIALASKIQTGRPKVSHNNRTASVGASQRQPHYRTISSLLVRLRCASPLGT